MQQVLYLFAESSRWGRVRRNMKRENHYIIYKFHKAELNKSYNIEELARLWNVSSGVALKWMNENQGYFQEKKNEYVRIKSEPVFEFLASLKKDDIISISSKPCKLVETGAVFWLFVNNTLKVFEIPLSKLVELTEEGKITSCNKASL